jgi:hypothetical protein
MNLYIYYSPLLQWPRLTHDVNNKPPPLCQVTSHSYSYYLISQNIIEVDVEGQILLYLVAKDGKLDDCAQE